jgi:hypothetical protein
MRILLLNILLLFSLLHGEETACEPKKECDTEKKEEKPPEQPQEIQPPPIGNFSLPTSQQPATLFGFGGNIFDEGEFQINVFVDAFNGKRKQATDVIPNIIFAVTDDWSFSFFFPFAPRYREENYRSAGPEDFSVVTEYVIYKKSAYCYVDQATVLGGLLVPTGSVNVFPRTGFGSPGYLVGGTFYRTLVNWIFFTAQGAHLTTSERGLKLGNQFFYQFGVSRNIPSPCGWIYSLMLEVDGQYFQKDQILGVTDPNTGGNMIYITPSLFISSKYLLMQLGISFPGNQNLFGHQNKFDYALNFNFAWSYY